jgi:hypothetical protein
MKPTLSWQRQYQRAQIAEPEDWPWYYLLEPVSLHNRKDPKMRISLYINLNSDAHSTILMDFTDEQSAKEFAEQHRRGEADPQLYIGAKVPKRGDDERQD